MAIEIVPYSDVNLSIHHVRPENLNPSPVNRVSFSAWKNMSDCITKHAFARDPQTRKWNTGSTAASLGTAAHKLIEQAWGGEFDGLGQVEQKSALEEHWELLIADQYRDLVSTPRLAEVPQPISWPRYFEKKILAFQGAQAIANRKSSDSGIAIERHVEKDFEPTEVPIIGTIDRLDVRSGHVSLVDLKTSDPDHEIGPRESYVEQLLFYAFAWWKETGEWPDVLQIEYQDGSHHDVDLDKNRATDLVADAVAKLRVFNSTPLGEFENVANPSEDACKWCNFRGACDAYISQDFGDDPNRSDFRGQVTSVGENRAWFDLELSGGQSELSSIRLLGVPNEFSPEQGELISVGNAVPRRGRNFGVNWQSVIWHRKQT